LFSRARRSLCALRCLSRESACSVAFSFDAQPQRPLALPQRHRGAAEHPEQRGIPEYSAADCANGRVGSGQGPYRVGEAPAPFAGSRKIAVQDGQANSRRLDRSTRCRDGSVRSNLLSSDRSSWRCLCAAPLAAQTGWPLRRTARFVPADESTLRRGGLLSIASTLRQRLLCRSLDWALSRQPGDHVRSIRRAPGGTSCAVRWRSISVSVIGCGGDRIQRRDASLFRLRWRVSLRVTWAC